MSSTNDINPVEFGRVLGHLESIEKQIFDLKERTVWRLDNLEGRVEIIEHERATTKDWGKWVEWAIKALVAIGGLVLIGKTL